MPWASDSPCIRPKNLFHLGAKVADQRYCAPTVGSLSLMSLTIFFRNEEAHIDAISARDSATRVVPMPEKILPYTIDAGPPLLSANWNVTAAASHEICNTKEKLIAGIRLMYRLFPISVLHIR